MIFARQLFFTFLSNEMNYFYCSTEFTLFENYTKYRIWILAFSTNFCPIKSDLSGNTVWPKASGFPKLANLDHFWPFWWTFVHSKCKCTSLRSQCWMRLFLWFSPPCFRAFIASPLRLSDHFSSFSGLPLPIIAAATHTIRQRWITFSRAP